MASGHANRAKRPNTWLHRPATQREVLTCQPGAVHTWHLADVQTALMNVRCEGNSGDNVDVTRCLLNDPRTCLIEGRMSKLCRQKAACC